MAPSKVIRIDEDVWAELQKRARPLEDNPNSLIRRILGLPEETERHSGGGEEMDTRVAKLLDYVVHCIGQASNVQSNPKNGIYSFRSRAGKVVAYIYPQKRRLKLETYESLATKLGIKNWNHRLAKGWFGSDNSVFWYVSNDDDAAYRDVAKLLVQLWRN